MSVSLRRTAIASSPSSVQTVAGPAHGGHLPEPLPMHASARVCRGIHPPWSLQR